MTLGEGFDPSATNAGPGDGPTGNVCVSPGEVQIQNAFDASSRWFVAFTKEELELKLSATIEGKIPGEDFTVEFVNGLEELYFSQGEERFLLGAMVEIETVQRLYAPLGVNEPGDLDAMIYPNKCGEEDETTKIESIEDFFTSCGDRYLRMETMGGYALLVTDLTEFSQEFRQKAVSQLSAGAKTDDGKETLAKVGVSLGAFLALGAEASNATFQMQVKGIKPPSAQLKGPDDSFGLDAWQAYIDELYVRMETAVARGETRRHSDYGEVIDQSFNHYSAESINSCAPGSEGYNLLQSQLTCHNFFWYNVEQLYGTYHNDPYTRIDQSVADVMWKLEHPNRVRWAEPQDETQQAYEKALTDYLLCKETTVPNSFAACDQARATDVSTICDSCQLAEECATDTIEAMFNNLPEAPLLPPEQFAPPTNSSTWQAATAYHVPQNTVKYITGNVDDICFWTGVGGRFRGTDEGVRLRPDEQGSWYAETWSSMSWEKRKLHMKVTCAPRSNFFDEGLSVWSGESDSTHFAQQNAPYLFTFVIQEPYQVATLAGISGKMKGSSEYFRIQKNAASATELEGASSEGELQTHVIQFGLENPANGVAQRTSIKNVDTSATTVGTSEVVLGSVTQMFCYLNQISGQFDGGGEQVRIEERDNNWWLVAKAGCEKKKLIGSGCKERKHVSAEARCYLYNQTTP